VDLVPPDTRLTGRWRRSLLVTASGDTDSTTDVTWLQAGELYVDLRLPVPAPVPTPTPAGVRCLRDLDRPAACALAHAEGFAGRLVADGPWARWERLVDLQPPSALPDEGRLVAADGRVVETGRHSDYVEHWHRAPGATEPLAALLLRETSTGAPAVLVRVGPDFAWARGRPRPLPPGARLADLVASAATTREAQDLLDAEVTVGRIGPQGMVGTRSSLPWRSGAPFRISAGAEHVITDDVAPDGTPAHRTWQVVAHEGTTTDLERP
jgi:allophanate hydrolase